MEADRRRASQTSEHVWQLEMKATGVGRVECGAHAGGDGGRPASGECVVRASWAVGGDGCRLARRAAERQEIDFSFRVTRWNPKFQITGVQFP